jgi:hypothetical protein
MLFAVLLATQALADGLPIVKTRFVIVSRNFFLNRDAEKVEAQRAIATALAKTAKERYPFLDWRADDDPSEAAATFIVKLTQEELDETRTSYFVKYEGVVRGSERRPVLLRLGSIRELYSAGKKNKPFFDRVTLETNVVDRTDTDLRTFATEFEDSFVRKIPLCTHKPRVDSSRHMIVIDFPWEKLQAAPGSILYIDVAVRKLDSEDDDPAFMPIGFLRLTDLERSGNAIGGFLGQIRFATVDTTEWNQQIITALDERRIEKISVHMQRYFFSDSGGDRAENPD